MIYRKYIKRILDILISFVAIIALLPVYLIIAVTVLISIGKPVFFIQERIGKDEKSFKMYKFRTMTNTKDAKGKLLPEEKRLTKVGSVLRSLSMDELPELFMILKGDMSFIGPRPLPVYYGPYFYEHEKKRHNLCGGLMPPDSLSGKAFTSWEEQFEYEVYYVENVSFLLDVKVLFSTVLILLKRIKGNYGSEFRPHLNVYRTERK